MNGTLVAAPPSIAEGILVFLDRVITVMEWFLRVRIYRVSTTGFDKTIEDIGEVSGNLFGAQDSVRLQCTAYLGAVNEGPYSPLGRYSAARAVFQLLMRRKKTIDNVTSNPDCARLPIAKPLIITGLPSSTNTLLHNLLACDPNARTICTDGSLSSAYESDAKIADDTLILDHQLFSSDFVADAAMTTLRSSSEYMLQVYVYFKRFLQFARFSKSSLDQQDTHVLLNSHAHAYNLTALLSVFPDARIVMTHRHPIKTVPLHAHAIVQANASRTPSNASDRHALGKKILNNAAAMANGIVRVRRCLRRENDGLDLLAHVASTENVEKIVSEEQFLDLHSVGLENDPISTVQEIYTYFGLEYSTKFETAMQEYLLQNPLPKYEQADIAATQEFYGISDASIQDAFADYMMEFDILDESE
ncbi:hypothetical protein HDU78_010054 [Chytriomyces hyalinus]|nr:hypothetical protein HDU78_010054 [Chytriomyces hyalinus]KAJ3253002.1 hypothetical protein HDU77_004826 [Chytriomyces hyalinus]